MNSNTHKIYAFIDPNINHSGNPCLLTSDPIEFPLETIQSSIASCKIQSIGSIKSAESYHVECKHHGSTIQCCGHGMLTAAYFIKNQLSFSNRGINHKNHKDRHNLQLYLSMPGCKTTATFDGDIIWLEFDEIECHTTQPPLWLKQLNLPINPQDFSQTSNENGYCIVQFKDDSELQYLPSPDKSIEQFTKRAIIYTSKTSKHKNTIFFRYFAPQYGNPEDIATGSAIRILANFWQFNNQRMTLKQLSSNGGLLFAERLNRKVRVGGICRWDNS